MLSSATHIAVVLACMAVACHAQGNYLDDDDFALPARPAYRPPARPAPVPQQPAAPRATPVPILKQINRHNEDGSYTYGYEGADGSFKIETKLTTGEVMGKYGYVDDVGKVRVVEYGANKYGFMPQGEGITVAPPTLVDETTSREALQENQNQRSRIYIEDDRVRYQEEERPRPAPRPAPAPRPVFIPEERPQPAYRAPAPQPAPYKPVSYKPAAPAYRPAPKAPSAAPVPPRAVIQGAAPLSRPAPVYEEPRPVPQAQPAYRPAPQAQPAYRPPPPPQPQPSRDNFARTAPSILDQLERDYALPQSSASNPYHDVSFGSF